MRRKRSTKLEERIAKMIQQLCERVDGATEISGCLKIKSGPTINKKPNEELQYNLIVAELTYKFREQTVETLYVKADERGIQVLLGKLNLEGLSEGELEAVNRGYSAICRFLGEKATEARNGSGDIARIYDIKI